MAQLVFAALALIAFLNAASCSPALPINSRSVISYENYKVYRVVPETEHQLKILYNIFVDGVQESHVDFWLPPKRVNAPVELMLSPAHQAGMETLLRTSQIGYTVKIANVQRLLDEERSELLRRAEEARKTLPSNFDFGTYHTFDEISAFISSLPTAFPTIASTFDVGKSYEGRQMTGIKIGKPGTNKKAIWIDAGFHAREWIAPATALFVINELTSKYGSDATITNLVDKLDWYILAAANPDGYEYSRTNDRMWRKTRSKQKLCFGVDPNRNFAYQFGGQGTSNQPCSDIYRGTAAFSEPETKAISTKIMGLKDSLKAYLTLHSYGQWWLVPYGYIDPAVFPPDYQELLKAAQDGAAALKAVHGTTFTVGNSDELLYAAAGASDDWSKAIPGIKFVYTMELRPNESSPGGFVLPANQIIPTGEETWAGMKVIAQRVLDL
jgi:hypothetical protein